MPTPMSVQVSGKHLNVGDALRQRITDSLIAGVGKYFERGGEADVHVGREGYAYRADVVVRLASGQRLEAHGTGDDAHAAFDAVLAKLESRVRRYKRRLKNHHAQTSSRTAEAQLTSLIVLKSDEAGAFDEDWDEEDHGAAGPPAAMIIAETQAALKTMPVAMAVMELDLADAPMILFRNAAHGGLSVIYRRKDGNIGWIDPERVLASSGSSTSGPPAPAPLS